MCLPRKDAAYVAITSFAQRGAMPYGIKSLAI
jgi:hypothetical protein